MAAARTATFAIERDLTVHERSLADNCFDEGQYEAAIAVLDELRSRKSKPYHAHIRQLLYIALYPPPSLKDQIEEEALKFEPGSPSKVMLRRHKSSLAPAPKATVAAQDLLMKFSRTNTPSSLACALPAYPENPDTVAGNGPLLEDSHIAREAMRIQNAHCCWEIIQEGFIQRGSGETTDSPRKGKSGRSTRMRDVDVGENGTTPAPVSDHAWNVLDWILTLFERDECDTERKEEVRYSLLLLKQIPPSRPETAPRWDMRMPLDVVFHALEQEREARRALGIRLLTLLINLTSTAFIDFPMFLNAVSARVSSLPFHVLSYLFSALPLTPTIARFKIMLCRHALGGSHLAASSSKPKPQVRARAQPRRRPRAESSVDNTSIMAQDMPPASTSVGDSTSTAVGSQGINTYPSISTLELLALLARPEKDPTSVLQAMCLKSELIVSFGFVQLELEGPMRDVAWRQVLQDGSLLRAVEEVFETAHQAITGDTQVFIQTRRDALLAIISTW